MLGPLSQVLVSFTAYDIPSFLTPALFGKATVSAAVCLFVCLFISKITSQTYGCVFIMYSPPTLSASALCFGAVCPVRLSVHLSVLSSVAHR